MDKKIFEILPPELQDDIYDFVGYKEQYNKVLTELKNTFKISKLFYQNNFIQNIIIHNYVIMDDDDTL